MTVASVGPVTGVDAFANATLPLAAPRAKSVVKSGVGSSCVPPFPAAH